MYVMKAAFNAGKLVNAGALIDPVDGGLLVFDATSVDDIKTFLESDPCKCCHSGIKYAVHVSTRYWRVTAAL